jgi:hypothetical protein
MMKPASFSAHSSTTSSGSVSRPQGQGAPEGSRDQLLCAQIMEAVQHHAQNTHVQVETRAPPASAAWASMHQLIQAHLQLQ